MHKTVKAWTKSEHYWVDDRKSFFENHFSANFLPIKIFFTSLFFVLIQLPLEIKKWHIVSLIRMTFMYRGLFQFFIQFLHLAAKVTANSNRIGFCTFWRFFLKATKQSTILLIATNNSFCSSYCFAISDYILLWYRFEEITSIYSSSKKFLVRDVPAAELHLACMRICDLYN